MAKKIEDILNPENEPSLVVERLVKVLRQSKAKGLALTKAELFDADRINWLDIAPVGEGGLLLAFLARLTSCGTLRSRSS